MDHEEAAGLVPELAHRRLDDAVTVELEAHLAECEECRASLETYRVLAEAGKEEDADGPGHPEPSELVEYALGASEPEGDWIRSMEDHLEDCPDCAEEVSLIRQGESELAGAKKAPGRSFHPAWAALAASVLLAVGGYSLHLKFRQIPHLAESNRNLSDEARILRSELAEAEEILEKTIGPVRIHVLPGVRLSGDSDGTVIPVDEGQSFVEIAPNPILPEGFRDDALFRFEIRDHQEDIVWQESMTAPEIERYMSPPGALAFRIPLSDLPDSEYIMVLVRMDGKGELPVFEKPFRLERHQGSRLDP